MTPSSSSPHVRFVTEERFEAEVLRAALPVLVDFTAAWCSPCKALAPILRSLSEERAGTLEIVAIDGDASPGLSARYGIKGFPTMILFSGGKEIARHLGLTSKERLTRWVAEASVSTWREDGARNNLGV
jgi:thioredoxin 1